jgi:GH43 family beta-xylosidase
MAHLLAYTRLRDEIVKENEALVINSLHLAYFEGEHYTEETLFTALNYNSGILFAKADYEENTLVGAYKTLLNPRISRLKDNSFGITAKRGTHKGEIDIAYGDKQLFTSTKDFITFSEYVWIEQTECNEKAVLPNKISYIDVASGETKITDVNAANVIEITEGELDLLKKRYGTINNGEVVMEDIKHPIDCSEFQINDYADPIVRYNPDNGKYYFMATTGADGNVTLTIREADTVVNLAKAQAVPLRGDHGYSFELGVNEDMRKLLLWAPELHKIGDYWYCLFASGGEKWYSQSCYIMRNTTGNLIDADSWEDAILYKQKDGITELYETGITLDMTYINDGDTHYVMWAQRETIQRGGKGIGNSDLFIATINLDNPSVLTSDPVQIATPEYGWEKRTTDVLEGPFSIKKGDDIYVTYSASGVDATYCVGCLTSRAGTDLLKKDSWTKMPCPILTTENGGEKGPGHCSFSIDDEGNELFIYHFFPGSYKSRSARARQLRWSNLGVPILNWNNQ